MLLVQPVLFLVHHKGDGLESKNTPREQRERAGGDVGGGVPRARERKGLGA